MICPPASNRAHLNPNDIHPMTQMLSNDRARRKKCYPSKAEK